MMPRCRQRGAPDPATANALLDRFGYDKRDRDGYRMAPGGKPLTLSMMLATGGVSREIQTLWRRNMDAIGLRFEFREVPFQDYVKELEAGKFQIYSGGYGGTVSGYSELFELYSPEPSTVNTTRFKLKEYDAAMEQYLRSPTAGRPGRRGAQDVRAGKKLHADTSGDLPSRKQLRATMGARLQRAGVPELLEVSRHRPRQAEAERPVMPKRLLFFALVALSCAAGAADPGKVLRVASPDIDTLDPQQFNDDPSFEVFTAIFEGLYE